MSHEGHERPIYDVRAMSACPLIDGVIGRRACEQLKIWGAAPQADGETRSASSGRKHQKEKRSMDRFCGIGRIGQGDQRLHCG